MSKALTRYTPSNYDNSMEVCEGGCWVDADEAEAELRRLEALAEMRRIALLDEMQKSKQLLEALVNALELIEALSVFEGDTVRSIRAAIAKHGG